MHLQTYLNKLFSLTPQARTILAHIEISGSITQREAILDHSVQSLTRRITELNAKGFPTRRDDKVHPVTGQRYARYSLASVQSLSNKRKPPK